MSRGPGLWQRRLLAAVAQHGMVYVCDLLPDDASKRLFAGVAPRVPIASTAGPCRSTRRRLRRVVIRDITRAQFVRKCARET